MVKRTAAKTTASPLDILSYDETARALLRSLVACGVGEAIIKQRLQEEGFLEEIAQRFLGPVFGETGLLELYEVHPSYFPREEWCRDHQLTIASELLDEKQRQLICSRVSSSRALKKYLTAVRLMRSVPCQRALEMIAQQHDYHPLTLAEAAWIIGKHQKKILGLFPGQSSLTIPAPGGLFQPTIRGTKASSPHIPYFQITEAGTALLSAEADNWLFDSSIALLILNDKAEQDIL